MELRTKPFRLVKKVNTPSDEFKHIVYFDNNNRVLVEDLIKNDTFITNVREFATMFKLNTSITTNWINLFGDYSIKFNSVYGTNFLYSITLLKKISTDIIYPELEVRLFAVDNNQYFINDELHKFSETVPFCIYPKTSTDLNIDSDNRKIYLKFKLPILPLYLSTTFNITKTNNIDNIKYDSLYMVYNNKIYDFPYGNINENRGVCIGDNYHYITYNKNPFTAFLYILLTSKFNYDYNFRLKNTDTSVRELSVDLDKIHKIVYDKPTEHFNIVSPYSLMYYLNFIDDITIDELYDKIFVNVTNTSQYKDTKQQIAVMEDFKID